MTWPAPVALPPPLDVCMGEEMGFVDACVGIGRDGVGDEISATRVDHQDA